MTKDRIALRALESLLEELSAQHLHYLLESQKGPEDVLIAYHNGFKNACDTIAANVRLILRGDLNESTLLGRKIKQILERRLNATPKKCPESNFLLVDKGSDGYSTEEAKNLALGKQGRKER